MYDWISLFKTMPSIRLSLLYWGQEIKNLAQKQMKPCYLGTTHYNIVISKEPIIPAGFNYLQIYTESTLFHIHIVLLRWPSLDWTSLGHEMFHRTIFLFPCMFKNIFAYNWSFKGQLILNLKGTISGRNISNVSRRCKSGGTDTLFVGRLPRLPWGITTPIQRA